jgi:pimeloyl-ACP methyl ester carboxylesterase
VLTELDLDLGDGRTLHIYDAAPTGAGDDLVVFWHHGTPGLGEPPEPLVPAAAALGMQGGIDGMVDDDLAYVRAWGFAPEQVGVPALLVHGEKDRIVPAAHSDWLARRVPDAELRLRPQAGHISVLSEGVAAMKWLTGLAHR